MIYRSVRVTLLLILVVSSSPAFSAGANVFVYHRFGDFRYPSTNTDLPIFQKHLEILKENSFTVLTLGEVVARLRGKRALPERCAVITVDDAYATFLSGAMPLLRRYGYSATLFVSTRTVGHPGYLDWEEIRSLAAEGVEIGNHSADHPDLLTYLHSEPLEIWKKRALEDISEASAAFLREIGMVPNLYAYPYGEYSPELIEIVKSEGFIAAAAQISGVVHTGSDLFSLPRFPMGGPYGAPESFREKLFMKPLLVDKFEPLTPIWTGESPPTLRIHLAEQDIDVGRMRCYASGERECVITGVAGDENAYIVRAQEPLVGRRNRYTLTAPGRKGGWYWFSYLWVNPQR